MNASWNFDDGILLEKSPDASRLTLWLPGPEANGFRHWERISEVPQSRFAVQQGICAASATSFPARQRRGGFLVRLLDRLRGRSTGESWLLPNGGPAQQCGERQSDLLLVWAENPDANLDESFVEARWPESRRRQRLGPRVYLLGGVSLPTIGSEVERVRECPHSVAEKFVVAARGTGDPRRQLDALADLGAAYLNEGYSEHAVQALGEALRLATELNDQARQSDLMCNLGWLTLSAGNAARALEIFNQAHARARCAGDRFAEKTALERIGLAYVRLNAPEYAFSAFEQSLTLARDLGDRRHEADLLWYLAIECAELGHRDEAIQHGQASIDLMQQMGNPKATWFTQHLQKFRSGEAGTSLGGAEEIGPAAMEMSLAEPPVAGVWAMPTGMPAKGPSLLRMAVSATKSMARFIGSGFKAAPGGTVQYRLRTCAACPHHTGLRCRLCGCFTSAKARVAHEVCPIGKWPA